MRKATTSGIKVGLFLFWLAQIQLTACGGEDPEPAVSTDTVRAGAIQEDSKQTHDASESTDDGGPVDQSTDARADPLDVSSQEEVTPSGFGLDYDTDGVEDLTDNCVFIPNTNQNDQDADGEGDECDDDMDGDDVPNSADFWPKDESLPGSGSSSLIYAHTASSLYTLNPTTMETTLLGDFVWPDDTSTASPLMADIALDQYGVLYAISFDDLFVCHPTSLECQRVGSTPKRFNGLTLVPREIMNSEGDVLIATTPDGGWHELTISDNSVTSEKLGNYGEAYSSNGDAFSIQGFGTFVTARSDGADYDIVAKVNPLNGMILDSVVDLVGFQQIKGLAGWNSEIFVFDGSGAILQVKLSDSTVKVSSETGPEWRGAGVRTSN